MPDNKMRKAKVFLKSQFAGILEETGTGFRFTYDGVFVKTGQPISLSLPLRSEPYGMPFMFPFFEGMTPEGWYKDIVCATKKIDPADIFGLLLITGSTAGAVTVSAEGA